MLMTPAGPAKHPQTTSALVRLTTDHGSLSWGIPIIINTHCVKKPVVVEHVLIKNGAEPGVRLTASVMSSCG